MGGGGGRCSGSFWVEALELWVAVEHGEVGVAAGPDGVLRTCFPGFAQGIQGFGFSV
jgi:hypothetical protein